MEPNETMQNKTQREYEVMDERGALIGTIVRPVEAMPVGQGREKVYLVRRHEGRAA